MTELQNTSDAARETREVMECAAKGPVVRLADRADGWQRYLLTVSEEGADEALAETIRERFGESVAIEAADGFSQGFSRMLVAIGPGHDPAVMMTRFTHVVDEVWRRL